MESSPLTINFHEEHNDIHCDLPNTFILDDFVSRVICKSKTGLSRSYRLMMHVNKFSHFLEL